MERENKNNNILLIILIVCISIFVSLYFIFFRTKDEFASNYTDWLNVKKSSHSLKIITDNINNYFDGENQDISSPNTVATYYCIFSDCKGKYIIDDAPFAIIKDGKKYVIYNYKSNMYKNLKITEEVSMFDILYYDSEVYGIIVGNDNNKYKIYSLKLNKYLSDYKYTNYENNSASLLKGYVLLINNNDENSNYDIINLNDGSTNTYSNSVYSDSYKGFSKGDKNNIFYLIPKIYDEYYKYDLINSNFKTIATTDYKFLELDSRGNVIVIQNNNQIVTYNNEGKTIKTSKYYKNIIMLFKGYMFVVDTDNYIKLIDFDDNIVSIMGINNENYIYHTDLSGWYKKDNKDAIYLSIENASSDEEEGFEYYYIPSTGENGINENSMIGGYEKPIIYLYPENDNTIINIKFEKDNLITTTYPKYKNEWNVIANKNGDLKDLENKYYYGLYFEENGSTDISFKEGFCVTKENAVEFLEEKLSLIGLNNKEKNEFIMYWLPVLERNEKNLVYFELTDSREKYNKLIVTPKVDSMLRMAIHIKKVDKKINIKEQKLPTFKRQGFTLIEWGGVNHK